jgi:hypothetical protein
MCFCSDALCLRALHYSIYTVYRILGSAFKKRDFPWKQIARPSTEKSDMAPFVLFFSLLFLHVRFTLYHSVVNPDPVGLVSFLANPNRHLGYAGPDPDPIRIRICFNQMLS